MILLCALAFSALQHFGSIEQEEVVEDVLQAQSLLQSEIRQLVSTAGDYASWDDTYRFVRDRNQNYIKHSLGEAFYSKLRLNLFSISNLDGDSIHIRYSAPDTSHALPVPEDLKALLLPHNLLFRTVREQKPVGGFIRLSDGLLMIAAQPVLTTESKGPVRGLLVMGRFLTREEVKRIGTLAQFTIGILSPELSEFSSISSQLAKQGANAAPVLVRPSKGHLIRGYSVLLDINSKQGGFLYLEKSRQIYLEARKIILGLALFSALVFSFVAIAFFRISQKLTIISIQEHSANQQLKTFIELAVDGIFRLDKSWRIQEANRQAAALTGYRGDELSGMPFNLLFGVDNLTGNPLDHQRLQAGLAVTLHQNLVRKGDALVPVEIRLKLLPDGSCQCVMQDRTEQSYWEGMLHQQQELLNGIINGTGDIIYAKDLNGRYLLINKTGLLFAGKTREEVLGLEDQHVFSPETAQLLRNADQDALAAGSVTVSEDTIRNATGAETIFLATRAPLLDKQGCITGLFAILHDVTVRSMLEKELLSQHNRLGQLAVSLSLAEEKERVRIAEELHDQVGPTLLSGKMKLNMLQSRLTNEAMITECESIDAMITQSVKDIRSLTLQLRPPILANAGLEAAFKWLAQEFSHKYGLQVGFSDDGQQKTLQYEKRTILFQAVRELLLNVVKHAQCSSAHVSMQKNGTGVRIIVEDNGTGFQRAIGTAGINPTGGFGLFNITQKLSYIHGRLTIDTSVEVGVRVIVDAPLDL